MSVKPMSKTLHLKKHLPCLLTDPERMEKGIELARCEEDIDNEDARQADLKTDMKARMTALESERSKLATIVRRNEEYRDVDVDEIYNYESLMVEQFRKDTGERITKREMTDSEKQFALDLQP